ncbi:MAG: DUF255 domain-containing protein [Ferruginibacter sp.]
MQRFQKALLFFILLNTVNYAFSPAVKEKINWISFEELQQQYEKNPKPIIIDLYTNWCGWCKEMDRTTYKHDKLATYINEHYYAVKYNAESKDSVFFNKIKYSFNKRVETNDLAMYLTFGRLEYPTTVFLASPDARPAPLSGYMKPKEMEAPLKYFVERTNFQETFIEFNKRMKKEW